MKLDGIKSLRIEMSDAEARELSAFLLEARCAHLEHRAPKFTNAGKALAEQIETFIVEKL